MADVDRIARLLDEVGATHHQVFRITDGADDDWATLLVQLDREYAEQVPGEPWPHWYAVPLAQHFG
jgi:hypothetical protein